MALPFLPLLLAKAAGKFVAKKAIAHAGHHAARHAAHASLDSKVVKHVARKAAGAIIDKAAALKGRKSKNGR